MFFYLSLLGVLFLLHLLCLFLIGIVFSDMLSLSLLGIVFLLCLSLNLPFNFRLLLYMKLNVKTVVSIQSCENLP